LPPDVRFLRLKCTKFNIGWGSATDPAGGAYTAPPDPLAGLRGPTSKGRGGDGKKRGGDGKGRGAQRRGGDETHPFTPPNPYFWIRPCPLLYTSTSLYGVFCPKSFGTLDALLSYGLASKIEHVDISDKAIGAYGFISA